MADSPFLPDTTKQFAWDSTSLGYLKECPRKYYYTMIRGLRGRGESVHLTFGSWYHKALEDYEKHTFSGMSHNEAMREVVSWLLHATWVYEYDENGVPFGGAPWNSEHNTKTRENLIRTVIWHLEQFGPDDPARTVRLKSGKPAVELSFRLQLDEDLILCGHLDRVVEFQGVHYVMDHKTSTTTVGSNYFEQYTPDNQMSLYTFAASIIYEAPVKGVIIDAAQIAVGFSRFTRGMVYRTDTQTAEWLDDMHEWVALAHNYAERDRWPMNDKSCHKYSGCPFRQICGSDARVRETFIQQNFHINHWNPLDVR